jgi:2,4-diketo-3-deoxy-L-fuconate hydrolase
VRLIRFGEEGRERPGAILADGRKIDASDLGEDYDERFFGTGGLRRLANWLLSSGGTAPEVPAGVRLGPPVARPSKIVCIGQNYRAHARESGSEVPTEPVIFIKASSAWCGPNDKLVLPRGSVKTDWEVELAVVVGGTCRYLEPADALDTVAGFALFNDVSEREFQRERGGQWTKGKSADTFASCGPVLVTPEDLPHYQDLGLWLTVNGTPRQKSRTADMIFDVRFLLSYVSRFMTLLPGDVLSTGTPEGVAMGMNPPAYLTAGDLVECGADGLGTQTRAVVASP